MHTAGFRYLGIDATYELIQTPRNRFASVVSTLREGTLNGVNVTMPHKRNAFDAADIVDESIERLGAVNTLVIDEDVLHGFNTDINGVVYALSRLDVASDAPVHVLGAGGAAAAALVATQGSRPVSISARDDERTTQLCRQLGSHPRILPWGDWHDDAVVINATPLGMHGETLPAGIVEASIGLIDMAYGDAETPSVQTAERLGIPYADGLVMLAGQAARAFHIFTGAEVPVDIMESAVRDR